MDPVVHGTNLPHAQYVVELHVSRRHKEQQCWYDRRTMRRATTTTRGFWLFGAVSCCCCWFAVLLTVATTVVDAKRRRGNADDNSDGEDSDGIPGVPFLIEWLGRKLYTLIDRPKYRFYLYMTLGKLPDESTFVAVLNVACNFMYCTSILLGFLLLPRNYMLIGTLVTLVVGPALILILIGMVGLLAVSFGLYPIPSVISIWIIFFSTSQMFQVLGRRLGLDVDGDGDVDVLDLLQCAARTSWGRWLGLPKLHHTLNQATINHWQEIKQRLDEILNRTAEGNETVRSLLIQEPSVNSIHTDDGNSK